MTDVGFNLIPAEEDISLDEQIAATLAAASQDDSPDPTPFGRGWAFDHAVNQFVAHGKAPAEVYGIDELRVWIEKTLRTARGAHPVYSESYGVDDPYMLIGRQFSPELIGEYAAQVREALIAHDRIEDVIDFAFEGGPDNNELRVSFRVVLDDAEGDVDFTSLPITRSA